MAQEAKHKMVRRIGLFSLFVVLGVAVFAFLRHGEIAVALLKRGAAEATSRPLLDQLKTGLHAGFCGTGSPLPDRHRAGPCLAVIVDGRLFIFDAGEGAGETLSLMGLPPARAEAVFLTHFHSDHIDGLSPIALQHWAGGSATQPLDFYGPEGVDEIVAGLSQMYSLDKGYRIAHHGPKIVPPSGFGYRARAFKAPSLGDMTKVYDKAGVTIFAFGVDHGPINPALGYKIVLRGQSIVISGDTKACDCVETAAKGANLLVHEALSPRLARIFGQATGAAGQAGTAQVFHDIENYHATPEQVADLAQRAGVKGVALTHIVPALPLGGLKRAFLADSRQRFAGPLWLAEDGDVVSIRPDGQPVLRPARLP